MSHVLVMGPSGLRADFSSYWAAKHLAVAVAREKLHDATAMPDNTEEDRRAKHRAVMVGYRAVEKAENALLEADGLPSGAV